MNLPNKLTIFRIILVPIMVIIPFLGIDGRVAGIPIEWLIIDVVFIIASLTDKLDGYLARKNNQVTAFGKFLDPLADKILVLAAMMMLVEMQKLPAWIPIIVLAREFMVSGYRLIAVEKGGEVIAASKWGKLKNSTDTSLSNEQYKRVTATISIFDGNGSLQEDSYILDSDSKTIYHIGRGKSSRKEGKYRINDIVINDNEVHQELRNLNLHVSSAHADIVFKNGNYYLRAAVGVSPHCRRRGAWLVSINMLKAGNMHICDSKTPECLT